MHGSCTGHNPELLTVAKLAAFHVHRDVLNCGCLRLSCLEVFQLNWRLLVPEESSYEVLCSQLYALHILY